MEFDVDEQMHEQEDSEAVIAEVLAETYLDFY